MAEALMADPAKLEQMGRAGAARMLMMRTHDKFSCLRFARQGSR
jgi:hypothetical protein